ncbi:MAG: hypothetical protein IPL94_12115 [Tetrasphaera sp.]|nr:hypothetical protein [Tetrasphaera sp.]
MSPQSRVRVTSSRRGASTARARPVARDLDEQTTLGDVYIDGLIRAQRRLSLRVLAVLVASLIGLPLLLWEVPSIRTMTLASVPLPWILIGVAIYPATWSLARWYARATERLEADFIAVVEEQ